MDKGEKLPEFYSRVLQQDGNGDNVGNTITNITDSISGQLDNKGHIQNGINDLFCSEKIIDTLKSIAPCVRDNILGLIIDWYLLDFDTNEIEQMLNETHMYIQNHNITSITDVRIQSFKNEILITYVAKKLRYSKPYDYKDEEKIYDYITSRNINHGYVYHGFNGAFKNSITQNGLCNNLRVRDENTFQKIQEIGNRTGNPMIFGWSDINCKGNTFLTETSAFIYQYANSGPEWFSQFCSEGSHIPYNYPGYDKKAYRKGDYVGAKQNITLFCEKLGSKITEEEKNIIIDFFDTHWKLYKNKHSIPTVALIPRKDIDMDKRLEFKEIGNLDMGKYAFGNDIGEMKYQSTINAENIIFIELPTYQILYGEK